MYHLPLTISARLRLAQWYVSDIQVANLWWAIVESDARNPIVHMFDAVAYPPRPGIRGLRVEF